MDTEELKGKCQYCLEMLCNTIPERCVGSEGNRTATRFFANEIVSLGWDIEMPEFEAIDWEDGGASLQANGSNFEVFVSPYSLGCEAEELLVSASSIEELEQLDIHNKILLLHGDIAKEQLMPKNFVFYNPDEHRKIISVLETGNPKAIITATGRNAALAGGVYPFPLIEDGDFNIPSVYMTEEEGRKLILFIGKQTILNSVSKRIPGKGYNVVARKGKDSTQRIVVTAHIDAKKGTPGTIDNATGVTTLLLLARLMADYDGEKTFEIVALNGEDYFSVPGQMLYVSQNQDHFGEILLNINIDGMGYKEGESAFSFYEVPEDVHTRITEVSSRFQGIVEGAQWPQGDHSIFVQNGCPAIAISSRWFTENMASQEITHTSKDNMEIVDCSKVVEVAEALSILLSELS